MGGLPFATGPLADLLRGHDLAMVIGAPVFRYYPYVPGAYLPDGLRLLHVTDDPAEAARAPVGDSLISSAGLAIELLTAQLRRAPREPAEIRPLAHRMAPHPPAEHREPAEVMTAGQLFAALRAACNGPTVLVEESPSNLPELHTAWPITEPDSFYTFASGGLGWNLPASVGIALAEADTGRHRRVVAVIGDGSFQYSVQSIWTAAQHQLPILFVVPRNGECAILKSFAALEQTPGVPGLDIPGIDFVALATAYGCHGVRAATPDALAAEVATAGDRPGPTLIEVPITAAVPLLL